MHHQNIFWFYFSTILILFSIIGCKNANDNPAQKSGPNAMGVNVIVIQPKELDNSIFSNGTVLANEAVELRSEVSGRIRNISFSEGNRVNKGDLLVKIVDDDLQAQLKKLTLQESLSKEDVQRKTKLLELDAISQEEFDQGQNQLLVIQAEIQLIKAQIEKTEIRAPFEGLIGLRYVSPGGYLSPSMLITNLLDVDPVKIEFSVPEKYLGQINKTTAISFTIDGNDSIFSGRVYAIEPKINPATRSLTIRAVCPNPKQVLLPGNFAKVSILLQKISDAIIVPSQVLIPDIKGEKVFVVSGGKARPVYIETGIRTENEVQVLSGLNVNDTIITTGLLQLKEGMAVAVRKSGN
jgi:membrane fusion protein (multidrug efflux system)